jgi:hypothetical protein
MDESGSDCAALAETTVFLQYFNDMPDKRQPGKVMYPLDEILLLCLLAVLAGAEAFTDIARFGEKKLDLLRRFRPCDGTVRPEDHDELPGTGFADAQIEVAAVAVQAWRQADDLFGGQFVSDFRHFGSRRRPAPKQAPKQRCDTWRYSEVLGEASARPSS